MSGKKPAKENMPFQANETNLHYAIMELEPIEVSRKWLTQEGYQGALEFNCIKYLGRWKQKGGIDDLKKLVDYATELLKHVEAYGYYRELTIAAEVADLEKDHIELPKTPHPLKRRDHLHGHK